MSMQALQGFIWQHTVSTAALGALAMALEAKTTGVALEPALEARVNELLAALGAADVAKDVGPQEAAGALSMVRALYQLDAKLQSAQTRTKTWAHPEGDVLNAIGDVARMHAHEITRLVIPAFAGLEERFKKSGAKFLDVGVGVAGTASAMAQMWPELRVVGIDVWQPSLRLARENVDRAALADRVELREQSIDALDDVAAFDLAWVPVPFIPEAALRAGLPRVRKAMRPGGVVIVNTAKLEGPPQATAAMQLRMTQWGGPAWTIAQATQAAKDAGLEDVRTIENGPESPASLIVGTVSGDRSR
jgi:predicted O-methyltransferase YrrM